MTYYYEARIGTFRWAWHGGDDRRARRVLGRLLRLVWPRCRARYPWMDPHVAATLQRTPCGPGDIVRAIPAIRLEHFDVDAASEFLRVWDAPRAHARARR